MRGNTTWLNQARRFGMMIWVSGAVVAQFWAMEEGNADHEPSHAIASPNASFPFSSYWVTAQLPASTAYSADKVYNEAERNDGEQFGLLGCVEACAFHGGVPLCTTSEEELRFVLTNVTYMDCLLYTSPSPRDS